MAGSLHKVSKIVEQDQQQVQDQTSNMSHLLRSSLRRNDAVQLRGFGSSSGAYFSGATSTGSESLSKKNILTAGFGINKNWDMRAQHEKVTWRPLRGIFWSKLRAKKSQSKSPIVVASGHDMRQTYYAVRPGLITSRGAKMPWMRCPARPVA